jgi:tetratricopeptide (TPR) repeat protein
MVRITLHRTPLTAGICVLAAAIVPPISFSQPASKFVADDEQRQLVDAINEIRAQEGPYSADLLDPYSALAVLYRESGDRRLAAAAIEQALQIVRANYGLRSLEQAPLLREQVLNDKASGHPEIAWTREQELLDLVRRHPDDLRTVPILREMGAERMDVLERYLAGQFPAEITLGCFYDPIPYDDVGSCYSGSKRDVVNSLLDDAWTRYFDAIKVLHRNRLYSSDELHDLEMELVRSSYAHDGFGVGRASLRRLFSYEVAKGAPRSSQIDALVQLADWDLLFVSARGAPLDLYEVAYAYLKLEETAQESIERVFSPDIPVVLPAFLPNPLMPDNTREHTGYIDVAFELTKFGQSRNIEIVGATENATRAAKEELVHLISRSRFRPRVTNGEFARTPPIVVRYYLRD